MALLFSSSLGKGNENRHPVGVPRELNLNKNVNRVPHCGLIRLRIRETKEIADIVVWEESDII